MKIFIKRERGRISTIKCTWRMPIVFMSFLTVFFITAYGLDGYRDINKEKKEIISVLHQNLSITKDKWFGLYTDTHDFASMQNEIEYKNEKYYIDLRSCNSIETFLLDSIKVNKLEQALRKIGDIRCNALIITPSISSKVVKMLIERMTIENKLVVNFGLTCSSSDINPMKKGGAQYQMDYVNSKTHWKAFAPLQISITNCSEIDLKDILNWFSTRKIEQLTIDNSDIKELILEKNTVQKRHYIALKRLPSLKRLVLPKVEAESLVDITIHTFIQLLTKIMKYWNIDIDPIQEGLYLDKNTFKSLVCTYKSSTNESIREVSNVKNLYLNYMPYTVQEIKDIALWIQVETVIIYVNYCNGCKLHKENVIREENLLYKLKNMRIECTKSPFYQILIELNQWNIKQDRASEFIQKVGKTHSEPIYSTIYCSLCHPHHLISSFSIRLEKSKELHEAVDEILKYYDTVPIYAHYKLFNVYGFKSMIVSSNIILLEKIFKCIGQRIRVDILSFHDIKGSNFLNSQEEALLYTMCPITGFILEELHFYNSALAFVKYMLVKYKYFFVSNSSVRKIYIDCKEAKKEEVYDVCREIEKKDFSGILLSNVSKVIDEMRKEYYDLIFECLKDRISLLFDNSTSPIKMSDIANCIFSKCIALSSAYINMLKEKSQPNYNKSKREKLFEFLIEESVEKTCAQMEGFLETIDAITELNVIICNYDPNHYTSAAFLNTFLEKIIEIFMDVKTIYVFNLRISEKEQSLVCLGEYIEKKNKYGTKRIYFETRKLFIGKEELAGRSYIIGDGNLISLVEGKLKESNVCINYIAMPLITGVYNSNTSCKKISFWINEAINLDLCIVCLESASKIIERYIIKSCGHSLCRSCACNLHIQQKSISKRCPKCQGPANFGGPFYLLSLKESVKEGVYLKEEDFEFVYTTHV
ncbi:hypothetical protein NEFER01_0672 [Nematocida sp. LUAm1]|nr:hypothetical protein NEFER01_0672 [Nematocida sp. LUAm1]